MTTNDPLILMTAGVAGMGLGIIYFYGLWWTIQVGLTTRNPALLFLGSMFFRTGITLTGFYFVSGNQWQRLVACLVGFVLARLMATRLANRVKKGADHAS